MEEKGGWMREGRLGLGASCKGELYILRQKAEIRCNKV